MQLAVVRLQVLHIRRNVVKLSGQPILVKEPKNRAGESTAWCRGDWRKMTICSGRLGRSDGAWDIHIRLKRILREGKLPDNLNVHSLWHFQARCVFFISCG